MKLFCLSLRRRNVLCVLAACAPGCAYSGPLKLAGVENFQKVNDWVYRGAQPTDQGFAALAKLGIRTVVDLRQIGEHSQAYEQQVVEAAGMRYVSVPMKGMSTPTSEQVSRVLSLLEDAAVEPVFVHCHRGADRTGAIIACYRIGHDHWQNKPALAEARSLGMSWYQRAMQNYVLHYRLPPSLNVPALITVPGSAH
jgi:uncharacterized protein (TIGR01244 family)